MFILCLWVGPGVDNRKCFDKRINWQCHLQSAKLGLVVLMLPRPTERIKIYDRSFELKKPRRSWNGMYHFFEPKPNLYSTLYILYSTLFNIIQLLKALIWSQLEPKLSGRECPSFPPAGRGQAPQSRAQGTLLGARGVWGPCFVAEHLEIWPV